MRATLRWGRHTPHVVIFCSTWRGKHVLQVGLRKASREQAIARLTRQSVSLAVALTF